MTCSRRGVSIPSAEAGGVRHGDEKTTDHIYVSAFQSPPPKRGACDAADWGSGDVAAGLCVFQSPPPKRGACDKGGA